MASIRRLCLRINDLLLALPSCGQESDDILGGKKPLKQEKSGQISLNLLPEVWRHIAEALSDSI